MNFVIPSVIVSVVYITSPILLKIGSKMSELIPSSDYDSILKIIEDPEFEHQLELIKNYINEIDIDLNPKTKTLLINNIKRNLNIIEAHLVIIKAMLKNHKERYFYSYIKLGCEKNVKILNDSYKSLLMNFNSL